jgi:DNA-binding protein HU-beta
MFVARRAQNHDARVVFRFRFGYDALSQPKGENACHTWSPSPTWSRLRQRRKRQQGRGSEAVNAVFDAIVANVAKGKRVTVVGFGTFLPRTRKARSWRSPVNGKEIRIHAKTIPAFAAGQGFKEAVDKT